MLPHDNTDILAASQIILYCSFASLILSSVVIVSVYNLSKKFFHVMQFWFAEVLICLEFS